MDLKDTLTQLGERISKLKENIGTEEATKHAFIMPFIQALGYDVFNPLEVMPEYTCDIGTKKGEKIDYAILKDGKPIILIEAKHWAQELTLHDNQLLRYFHVSTARFGMLTNGIIYRLYTDIDKTNVMDEKPFLEIDMENLSDAKIEELKKFHKSYFNENEILSSANELKLNIAIKNIVKSEFVNPSDEFTRFFVREINEGKSTAKMIEQYAPILKKCIQGYINDIISERLNVAIESGKEKPKDKEVDTKGLPEGVVSMSEDGSIITTQEEIDAYNIIRSILRGKIDAKRITYKDYKGYFVISVDDSQWFWICRLSLKQRSKRICFPTEKYKSNEWVDIETIEDIFTHSDRLFEALKIALKE